MAATEQDMKLYYIDEGHSGEGWAHPNGEDELIIATLRSLGYSIKERVAGKPGTAEYRQAVDRAIMDSDAVVIHIAGGRMDAEPLRVGTELQSAARYGLGKVAVIHTLDYGPERQRVFPGNFSRVTVYHTCTDMRNSLELDIPLAIHQSLVGITSAFAEIDVEELP